MEGLGILKIVSKPTLLGNRLFQSDPHTRKNAAFDESVLFSYFHGPSTERSNMPQVLDQEFLHRRLVPLE